MAISKEIIEILDYIGQKFGIAIDWSSDNVIPYIQSLCEKYIAWEIATSTAWFIGAIIVFVLLFVLCLISEGDSFAIAVTIVMGFALVPIIGFQIYDIITCNTFPELKIFNFLRSQLQQI